MRTAFAQTIARVNLRTGGDIRIARMVRKRTTTVEGRTQSEVI
jgi:hypothetical protein